MIAGVLFLTGIAMFSGCGGGNSDPVSTTAVLAFSAISTAQLPARISGIRIAVILPSGVSVSTDPAIPKQISATALAAGSAMDALPEANRLVMGSYSSAGRLVRISAADASGTTAFGPGEFVRLTCVVGPGVTVTESGITALNSPPATFTVSGYDANTRSTVDLTGYLAPHFALKSSRESNVF